jgi:hypothetical protein
MRAYRVRAEIITDDGKRTTVSFIVKSGGSGWKSAVAQAHMHLADLTVVGDVSVDQVWPKPEACAPGMAASGADHWRELRDYLDAACREAYESWRGREGLQPGTARAARSTALGEVRARIDEIEARQ